MNIWIINSLETMFQRRPNVSAQSCYCTSNPDNPHASFYAVFIWLILQSGPVSFWSVADERSNSVTSRTGCMGTGCGTRYWRADSSPQGVTWCTGKVSQAPCGNNVLLCLTVGLHESYLLMNLFTLFNSVWCLLCVTGPGPVMFRVREGIFRHFVGECLFL